MNVDPDWDLISAGSVTVATMAAVAVVIRRRPSFWLVWTTISVGVAAIVVLLMLVAFAAPKGD